MEIISVMLIIVIAIPMFYFMILSFDTIKNKYAQPISWIFLSLLQFLVGFINFGNFVCYLSFSVGIGLLITALLRLKKKN